MNADFYPVELYVPDLRRESTARKQFTRLGELLLYLLSYPAFCTKVALAVRIALQTIAGLKDGGARCVKYTADRVGPMEDDLRASFVENFGASKMGAFFTNFQAKAMCTILMDLKLPEQPEPGPPRSW